jgi:hypothetical protein
MRRAALSHDTRAGSPSLPLKLAYVKALGAAKTQNSPSHVYLRYGKRK